MARYSGTTKQRGLGQDHVSDKKRLLKQLRDGDPCWRCGQPMYKSQKLDRDHVIDRALGGAQGPAVLAHAACNRAAGAKLGNRLQPRAIKAAGRDTVCRACGKPYHYAARACEVCGRHYHPSRGDQRTCGRTCGVRLQRRNKVAVGWVPPSQRLPKPRAAGPVASGEREPKNGWRAVAIAYYTCRYCGKTGVTRASAKPGRGRREVCEARECQLARLTVNNLITRDGMTREQAEAAVRACRGEGGHRGILAPRSRQPVQRKHSCPACGQQTSQYSWCEACLCGNVNAKGKRCGNPAGADGKCDYHAEAAARQPRDR